MRGFSKVALVFVIFLAGFIFFCVCAYVWYTGGIFPNSVLSEKLRRIADQKLQSLYYKKWSPTELMFKQILHMPDSYAFQPPRVIRSVPEDGNNSTYHIYGLVKNWDAARRLLFLTTFSGKDLYLKLGFDSGMQYVILPKFDEYGLPSTTEHPYTFQADVDTRWEKAFCSDDVVRIAFDPKINMLRSSSDNPIVPLGVSVVRRICTI